jgi:hypothetical protein
MYSACTSQLRNRVSAPVIKVLVQTRDGSSSNRINTTNDGHETRRDHFGLILVLSRDRYKLNSIHIGGKNLYTNVVFHH